MAETATFTVVLKDLVSGAAKAAQNAVGGLGKALSSIGTDKGLGGVLGVFKKVPGPVGEAAGKVEEFGEKLKALAAAGPVGLLAVLAAVAVAIGEATFKLSEFALEAADAKRSTLLAFEGLLGSAEAARDLSDAIDGLRHHTAVSSDRLEQFGRTLAFAGLRGHALEEAMQALAKVEATAGPEMVNKFLKRIRAGEDYKKILDDINKKHLADVGEKQAASFNQQIKDLKADLADLFEDVNIEPFLAGLREVLMLFSEQTATGAALKTMLTSIFSGIFKVVSAVFPYIKAFIQGLVIGFLRVYIVLKPVISAIAEAFGGSPNTTLLDFVTMLAEAFVYVATVVAFLIGLFATVTGIFVSMVAGIGGVIAAILGFASGFFQAGYNFVAGLAQGISSGASAVIQAALGVAQGAINAVKGALGIQSPSKVMAQMGLHTAAGFAGGVEAGNDNAQQSMANMVAPPAAAGGGTTNNKSASVVMNNTINVTGGGASVAVEIETALTRVAERLALQLGAA